MAKTLVFAISMSEPTSGLINRVSVWSRNNMPRRLTLIWPKASCTTTCCPIHHSNAFCKPPCSIRDEVHPNLDERTSSVRDVGKQTGETLQRMRTFAALKGLGVGVGPVG